MAKTVYVIMACNEWKEFSSMRIYAACTSFTKLRTLVARGIERNFFSYGDENLSFKRQAKQFRAAWREALKAPFPDGNILDLCGKVRYACVFACLDGEAQQVC